MDPWPTIIGAAIALAGILFKACIDLATAYINKESEEKKQKLQFEYSNLQKALEERKASCRKLIDEMYKAIKLISIHQPYDEPWEPISRDNFEAIREALFKEIPFVDKKIGRALKLFLGIMGDTVDWPSERDYPPPNKHRMIIRAYDELEYLYYQITIFIQSQINIEKELPPILSKVALLEACKFASQDRFEGLPYQNRDIIRIDGSQSPMDILQLAENNSGKFKKEFSDFFNFLKTNPLELRRPEFFMSEIAKIERLIPDI